MNLTDQNALQFFMGRVTQIVFCSHIINVNIKKETMMKRMPKFLMLLFCLGGIFRVGAEIIIVVGDYTTPASTVVDGDLIVTNGSIKIFPSASLMVNGDVKISSGSVFLNDGSLTVKGDLIVTNSLPGGGASVVVNGNIAVSGSIMTHSMFSDADVTTTGVAQGGSIEAESITTDGVGKSNVYSKGSITVVGEIATKSSTSDAFVESIDGSIYAGRIITKAHETAHVKSYESIGILGELITQSAIDTACVRSGSGDLYAGSITTRGALESFVEAQTIDVKGAIKTKSSSSTANVVASSAITAGAIITNGYGDSTVVSDGNLEVRGDLVTRSIAGDSYVFTENGSLFSVNVTTSAAGDAYVRAEDLIDVRRDIWTHSGNAGAYVTVDDGSMYAYKITTNGALGAYVRADDGYIMTKGPIFTKGYSAHVYADYDIEAESVFIDGNDTAYVKVGTSRYIDVKDVIRTKASAGSAYVQAGSDITARSIETSAGSDGYVQATSGSINIVGDIRTYATGDAYVQAPLGDVNARSIKTVAGSSSDDSIKAAAGTGRFQWFPDTTDQDIVIKDSEFYLDIDHDWNVTLTVEGNCVLNGNAHQLLFGSSGGIVITPGSSLMLKNIILDSLSGTMVRCEDDTATLSLHNVTWTQIGDTQFANGTLHVFGECIINGPNTQFNYESSQTSTIHENSTLLLTQGVTLRYDTDEPGRIAMVDPSSQLSFNGAGIYSLVDLRFTRGTLVFENRVPFTVETGRTLYFGGAVNPVDNIALDFHLRSVFDMFGVLQKDNV